MHYTLYFKNHNTGVVAAKRYDTRTARGAEDSFRRTLRNVGELTTGQRYNIVIYEGCREIDNIPYEYLNQQARTAR